MRVAFAGTPDFAVPTLERLVAEGYDVAWVATQPDRPAGRGLKLQPPAVKLRAQALNLPVWQPERPTADQWAQRLREARADALVVAAYAHKIPASVLSLPPLGCLNVHASLLPRWRGAAPIAWALLAGDRVTGVTILQMDEGWDTGPIVLQRTELVRPDDTQATLHDRLARLGARLLVEALRRLAAGTVAPVAQDPRLATVAPRIQKEQGRLDWNEPACVLERRVRALHPWPGAYFLLGERVVKVLEAFWGEGPGGGDTGATGEPGTSGEPGTVVALDPARQALGVSCGRGVLFLRRVQVEGGRPMTGTDLANGYRLRAGFRFAAAAP